MVRWVFVIVRTRLPSVSTPSLAHMYTHILCVVVWCVCVYIYIYIGSALRHIHAIESIAKGEKIGLPESDSHPCTGAMLIFSV